MSDKNILSTIAKSKTTANRLARALSLAELKRAIKNLELAAAAIQKKESAKAEKVHAANLKKLKVMMDKMGLSATDVTKLMTNPPKRKAAGNKKTNRKTSPRKGKKVAPKYSIKSGKEVHKWTGRGRMPLIFREFLEKGGSLDHCLIK